MATTPRNLEEEILQGFANNSQFLSFSKLNPIEGIYRGVSREDDPNKPGETRLAYAIEVEGERKTLTSSSKKLAKHFLEKGAKVGDFVKITRNGSGFDTDYTVEVSEDGIPF